jgi:hypothetical protein
MKMPSENDDYDVDREYIDSLAIPDWLVIVIGVFVIAPAVVIWIVFL